MTLFGAMNYGSAPIITSIAPTPSSVGHDTVQAMNYGSAPIITPIAPTLSSGAIPERNVEGGYIYK